MRIWDIHPGYLNRQSLLGEHRELHAVVSILVNKKTGYSKHPETMRWMGHGWALGMRHQLLAAEMLLRGYKEKSPVEFYSSKKCWPVQFIDEPYKQFMLLKGKYAGKAQGRIPLPENAQQLWRQHKYSVLARDPVVYKEMGRAVSCSLSEKQLSELSERLIRTLRVRPTGGGLRNSLEHMWGYVSSQYPGNKEIIKHWSSLELLQEIQLFAMAQKEKYLLSSTALSELAVWCDG